MKLCDLHVSGLERFISYSEDKPIDVVPGIEFSTGYKDKELHILGLFVKPENFGAVFFMPIALFVGALIFRRRVTLVFDIFTVPLLFTLLCSRINCLLSGCCKGKPIPFLPDLQWPVRESEIVFYAVLIVIFAVRIRKGLTYGEVYPIYMISYGVFRFITQFWRVSYFQLGPLHLSHYWAILSVIIGIVFLVIVKRKNRKVKI